MESCVRGYHIYQELWEAVIVCSPVKKLSAFNFRHLGNRRKIFDGENFPIYRIYIYTYIYNQTCIVTNTTNTSLIGVQIQEFFEGSGTWIVSFWRSRLSTTSAWVSWLAIILVCCLLRRCCLSVRDSDDIAAVPAI